MNLLSKSAVLKRVPVSDTTLWRMCRDGDFPKPVKISDNRVGWIDTEVDNWFAAKATKLAA